MPARLPIAIGLVGCGPWGGNILRDLQVLGIRVEVAARHEVTRQRALDGGASFVGKIGDLLDHDLDGFVVAVNASDHGAAIRTLLPTGKPIFVEKPLSLDPVSAREIANLGDGQVFMMDKWRYHSGVAMIRALVIENTLGPVVGIRTRRNEQLWHHDCEQPWTLLPHDLAIIEELIGVVPPIQSVAHDRVGNTTFGLIATLGPHPWVSIECLGRATERAREVTVFCSEGTISLPHASSAHVVVDRFHGLNREVTTQLISCPGEWPLLAELREFVAFLHGGPTPRVGVASGLHHVEIIDRLMRWTPTG